MKTGGVISIGDEYSGPLLGLCTVSLTALTKWLLKTVTISDGPLYRVPLSLISIYFVTLLCPFPVSLCRQSQICLWFPLALCSWSTKNLDLAALISFLTFLMDTNICLSVGDLDLRECFRALSLSFINFLISLEIQGIPFKFDYSFVMFWDCGHEDICVSIHICTSYDLVPVNIFNLLKILLRWSLMRHSEAFDFLWYLSHLLYCKYNTVYLCKESVFSETFHNICFQLLKYFLGVFMALLIVQLKRVRGNRDRERGSKGIQAGSRTQDRCRASAHGTPALPTELNSLLSSFPCQLQE